MQIRESHLDVVPCCTCTVRSIAIGPRQRPIDINARSRHKLFCEELTDQVLVVPLLEPGRQLRGVLPAVGEEDEPSSLFPSDPELPDQAVDQDLGELLVARTHGPYR